MDTQEFISPLVVHTSTVVSFEIPSIDEIKCKNVRLFKVKEFEELKKKVIAAKNLYDEPYARNAKYFSHVTRHFEHATLFRQKVHDKYNTPNVSNAWLKAYEMFTHYNLFPERANKFIYFDNAAFPGSFILAAWHYVNTKCEIKEFKWYGSSLITDNELTIGALEDKYKLFKNYPDHWLMSENNNGDVLVPDNQFDWKNRLGGQVDLYTSDLGFDVSSDYNKQELLHSRANLAQIFTGLLVLKKGGNMLTKQYSCFEPITISLMGIMTRLFDTVEICKPMFSKSSNSETYLVCLGYKGYDHFHNQEGLYEVLLGRLTSRECHPVITKKCLGNGFLKAIIKSQTHFSLVQIEKIHNIISEFNKYAEEKITDIKHITSTNMFRQSNNDDLMLWERINPLSRLTRSLMVKEVISRKKKYKR